MASTLSTPATLFPRTKYFAIPLYCSGMLPNTTYDLYLNGSLWNAYCKPHGGNLGSPLISGQNGKIQLQMHVQVNYNQQYLVPPSSSKTNIVVKKYTITMIDPFNNSSQINIPITLKAGALNY